MAIPIGPWIAPTLALIAIVVYKIFCRAAYNCSKEIALATSAGSVGGILATAVGFYFTTLYFLEPNQFALWISRPLYFSCVLGLLSFIAGLFGFWVANLFEHKLIVQDKLSFPIGMLVYKTVAAYKEVKKSIELVVGFAATGIFCFLQDGLGSFKGVVYKSIVLISPKVISIFKIPMVRLDLWPMLWALGFVTGHLIALPLTVGVLSKILFIRPMHLFFFSRNLKWMEFILTFCSGMVLSTAIFGFISTPQYLWRSVKSLMNDTPKKDGSGTSLFENVNGLETVFLLLLFIGFLSYFKFSFLSQIYLFVFSFICTYQLAIIAGKIGLAPMGKFATFVMVPAMFLFSLNAVQIVIVASFVGICGGVASDILFGRKLAYLSDISIKTIKRYQYFGLIVSSLSIGGVFWFLISKFQLGSDQLFALRAQNRWFLINTLKNVKGFDYNILIILMLGLCFGYVLSRLKISPLLVLGGLFMPINISLGLVIGAIGAMFVDDRQEWYPFWSGVYASNSIWMLVKSIF